MMLTGDPEGFALLTGEIARAAGMQLGDYKEKVLRRRIAVRMRARGAESYQAYGDLLRNDPAGWCRWRSSRSWHAATF